MANEFNAARTAAEKVIDIYTPAHGHTDANIGAFIDAVPDIDITLLRALVIQLLDRVESLEAP